jgi:acetyl-CoA carboxylase, biotin carboxylase subunit
VHNEDDLASALKVAQAEAESAFGSPDIYIEKEIEDPRHIEIQILADSHGHVAHLGERDCSVQTARYQKMLEEAPSIGLNPALRSKIGESAVKAAKAVGYTNAGTVEFLVDKNGGYYFMEMNTRVQVEHPVTEAVTGIDVVREQLRIASGEKLSFNQKDVHIRGHAIECRITAEDPENGFTPTAGKIDGLVIPGGFGTRVDTHIYSGYEIPPYYDSLLAKLIVWGDSRAEAITRMTRCLNEFQVGGIKTNVEYQKKIMNHPDYRKGEVSIGFLKRMNGG